MGLINEDTVNGSPIIALLDMDAYEWQCVVKDHPEYAGKPGIVVNFPFRIVAVSYEARAFGINRKSTTSRQQALADCPNLIIHVKEMEYGKPASRLLRKHTFDIRTVIQNYLNDNSTENHVTLDCASNDEYYLNATKEVNHRILKNYDLNAGIEAIPEQFIHLESTKQKFKRKAITYRMGQVHPKFEQKRYDDEIRLLHGAAFVFEIVEAIRKETGFTCSVGVSNNLLLAKLACGLNKPNTITVLPLAGVRRISKKVSISNIPGLNGRNFGGKLREVFNIRTMFDLQNITAGELNSVFRSENCTKLIGWGLGISNDVVQQRTMKLTLTCGKGDTLIRDEQVLQNWFDMDHLCGELMERLEEERERNKRRPLKISVIVRKKIIGSLGFDGNDDVVIGRNVFNSIQDYVRDYTESETFPFKAELKLFIPEFVPLKK